MVRYWGIYHEKQGWWLRGKTSNDYDHVDYIVFYPLRSIAEAHIRQIAGLYGTDYARQWSAREFEQDDGLPK